MISLGGSGTELYLGEVGNRLLPGTGGETWTARSAAGDNAWHSVAYGNGLFVAVAGDGTNRVMTSPIETTTLRAYLGDTQVYGPPPTPDG